MGLLDNAFDTSRLLADRRRLLANEAAKLDSGRGAVALAASGRERLNQGVNSMMGIETPEVANANKLQGILQKHSNIRTSTDAMSAANDLLNAGFSEYAQKMIENATAMRNSEAQMINANKISRSTTDPNIAKKRQTEINASEWLGTQSMVEGYEDTVETKKQQLLEMKRKGWVSTEAYKNLQKDIDDEEKLIAGEVKRVNEDVKSLSGEWTDLKIPQTEAALVRMENIISEYVDEDGNIIANIPGINMGEKLLAKVAGNTELGQKQKRTVQALAAIKNALLKERSGAAVTVSEYDRFIEEVQAGFADDQSIVTFIRDLRTTLESHKTAIISGYDNKVQNKYLQRIDYYPTITSEEAIKKLPSGTIFFDDKGERRTKT